MYMWASLSVGESSQAIDMGHDLLNTIASSLSSHPHVNEHIAKSIAAQTVIVSDESK